MPLCLLCRVALVPKGDLGAARFVGILTFEVPMSVRFWIVAAAK